MTEHNQSALVAVNSNEFKMPKFGKRKHHLQQILTEINLGQKADLIDETETNTNKAILKMAESIGEGTLTTLSQMNMRRINKQEIEGKLKKLALFDNILTYQEVKDKLNLLNQNTDLLKETQLTKYESRAYKSLNSSAQTTQRVKELESQLGLSLIEGDRNVTTLKESMRETKNTFIKNQKQAEEFVTKLHKVNKDLERHFKALEKKEKERHLKLESHRKEADEKYQEQIRAERESKRKAQSERRDKNKLERKQKKEEWLKLKQKINDDKYLHEKIEENFKEKVLLPELEMKKSKLKEKRELYKPINHQEIEDFRKKCEENFNKKYNEMKQVRQKRNNEIENSGFDTSKYKTKIMEKVLQEDVSNNDKKMKDIEDKRRRCEKITNYYKVVKELHWPEASDEKRKEIEEIKTLLNQRNKRRSARPLKRNIAEDDDKSDEDEKPLRKRPVWNFFNPMVPKPIEKREVVRIDYLRALREQREVEDKSKQKHDSSMNWDSLKNHNIDDKTKIELIKARTKLIEENAERKEQMSKIKGLTVVDNVDINDMLIDAIEMKLSILDQIE